MGVKGGNIIDDPLLNYNIYPSSPLDKSASFPLPNDNQCFSEHMVIKDVVAHAASKTNSTDHGLVRSVS